MPAPAPRAARRREAGSAALLPLSLPEPSLLPGRIAPERSVPCEGAFDDPGWWFGVDWEGMRALLFCDASGEARLQGERLEDRSGQFPEVIEAGARIGRAVVLDELVTALDPHGRPHLGDLAQRLTGGRSDIPAVFLVTDLLHLDGESLLGKSFERRLDLLRAAVDPGPCVQVPEWVRADGVALAEAARQRGLGGVVARDGQAPYRAGLATHTRLTISLADRVPVVVTGVEFRSRGAVRLHLGEYVDGRLLPAGRCEATLDRSREAWLRRQVAAHRADAPVGEGSVGPANTVWLQPHLTAVVSCSGRAADGGLQDSVCAAIGDHIEPGCCVRRPPVPAPGAAEHAAFRPAVLSGLPLGR